MKKTLFFFALVLISAITFSSCSSLLNSMLGIERAKEFYQGNLSELPAIDSAVITFDGAGTAIIMVRSWNGNNDIIRAMYASQGRYGGNTTKTELTVPSGDNSFMFDLLFFISGSNTSYKAEDIELQYYLAAGYKYIVKPRLNTTGSGNARLREFFIGIYPDAVGSEPLKEWKLGESRGY